MLKNKSGKIFICLLFSGCATATQETGIQVTPEMWNNFVVGKTSIMDVTAKLGTPQMNMQVPNQSVYFSKDCGKEGDRIQMTLFVHTTSESKITLTDSTTKTNSNGNWFFFKDGILCRKHQGQL